MAVRYPNNGFAFERAPNPSFLSAIGPPRCAYQLPTKAICPPPRRNIFHRHMFSEHAPNPQCSRSTSALPLLNKPMNINLKGFFLPLVHSSIQPLFIALNLDPQSQTYHIHFLGTLYPCSSIEFFNCCYSDMLLDLYFICIILPRTNFF